MKSLALLLPLLLACQALRASQVPLQATIMQIQGTGQLSPLKGKTVETSGVVTLVTVKKDGFWIQDPAGDGDPATSDGIFVFGYPSLVVPTPGDQIRILGRVEEEQKGNELPRTRLAAVESPRVLSRQVPLPEPVAMTKLPDVSMAEGIAFWEALEGMRVRVDGAPVISPTNRFREFDVLAPGNAIPGSGYHPRSGYLLVRSLGGDQVDYAPERIMVGDATQEKPAVVSAGDRVESLVGVVDYTFGYYKVQPETLNVAAREIPKAPVSVRTGPAGNFVITTYNLWDFFDPVPRPIDERFTLKPDEFDKRVTKIAQSIVTELELPQIVAVQEAEGTAIDALAEKLNGLANMRYQAAWLPTSDWRGLSMGFLYDSARVKLRSLTQLSGPEVEEAFGRKAAVGNREPLVGVFEAGPGIPPITVICNKIKTKRAEESPFSIEPPFRFTELQRKPQMRAIRKYLDSIFEKDPNAYVVVTGDLGDYDFAEPGEGEDHPLAILKGLKGTDGEVPMTNLVSRVDEAGRFDYLFQGAGVVVSHTLVSPALLEAFAGADILHFNTPFPEAVKWDPSTPVRASDRDPLEVRFQLGGERISQGFRQVFQAGTRDPEGRFMGGTEVFNLVRHGGKLWALTGYPYDQPGGDPTPGAQILVLDRPDGEWRVDYEFGQKKWRANLDSFTFTTDGRGRKLDKPVSILVGAPADFGGEIVLYSRDDATGTWTPMPLAKSEKIASVRSLALHRDRVTGVDRIFAGVLPNGLYSGVYDPEAPGRIRWDAEPELTGYDQRPLSFAECNGVLYMAAKPHLFRRIDGEQPRWETAYTIPGPVHKFSFGLRGLTPIPNPSGPGEVLLAALEGYPAWIIRLDPAKGFESTLEVDLVDFVERHFGRKPSWVTAPHNDLTPVIDPATGRTIHLIGSAFSFAPISGEYPKTEWDRGAWYLVRHEGGRYEIRKIVTGTDDPELIATRSIVVSPFGDGTLYFAGYNPNGAPAHNTGWIFAAPLETALAPREQKAAGGR
ncbi:MAG TPA: hypothetical protein VN493_31685 [Thermoanaerobaculia bacterium]|nr:hypothetical protein [Thermoanaerobaculia bacterium]